MTKLILAIVLLLVSSSYSYAIDGHNKIKFNMTQKQLEKIGFICNPVTDDQLIVAKCKHMDMTGVAFNVPAQNYTVTIGRNKKVAEIKADLIGISDLKAYIKLKHNIDEFFPNKNNSIKKPAKIGWFQDGWIANNNAGINLYVIFDSRDVIADKYRRDSIAEIVFNSPNYMTALTKKNVNEVQKKDVEGLTVTQFYLKGMDAFKVGDMLASRNILTKFIELYPKDDLAGNAQYWIGETYYNEKKYEPAILAFQEVIKNFPTNLKVQAAMLRQAKAFNAINDTKSAGYVLKKLEKGFPNSDEAIEARELLKDLK
jgi:tol-pal system protein YbgF